MGPILISIGVLVFSAHLFAVFFKKKRVPDVLLLIIIGLIIGPLLHLVDVNDLREAGAFFSSVTLVFILFEGGTDISIKTLKDSWKSLMRIMFPSFVLSVLIVGFIGWRFLDLSVNAALLLGTILGGTGSTVVIPLVRQLNIREDTKTILMLESAITVVLSIVIGLAFLETFDYGSLDVFRVIGKVVSSFVMATLIGITGGIIWSSLLEKTRTIQNSMFLTPAFVFIIYGISESMEFSGAISALAFGIAIANTEYFEFPFLKKYHKGKMDKLNPNEKSFFSEVVFLLKTFFFVYIGISIPFDSLIALVFGVFITLALFIMRLILTRVVVPQKTKTFDKAIISTMIPKGLAAAVLATIPEQKGIPGGETIKYVVYSVVFVSIAFTSILILLSYRYPKVRRLYWFFFSSRKKDETEISTTIEPHQQEENTPKNDSDNKEDNR